MPIAKPHAASSSSDIELPVLISHAHAFQLPPHEQASSSNPIPKRNPEIRISHPTDAVDEIEPPTPAYFPPSNDNPPIPSFDAGLLEYTRMHGHSEMPLSPRQQENNATSIQAGETHAEPLPAYGGENPPVYTRRPTQHDLEEPTTWPMLCFKLGFVFPLLWICGALTLITPQGFLSRLCMPWFRDFAASSTDPWCHDNMQTEAEKEAYMAHMHAVEIAWAKRCFFASSLLLCFVAAITVTLVAITKVH